MGIYRVLKTRKIKELLEWAIRRSTGLATASARLLPDYIIIGAQRCGTTSLYQYLCQHPDIYPSYPKEIHYFSNYYSNGLTWYRSHFSLQSDKKRVEDSGKQKFLTGEATPYYLAHPHAARRVSEILPDVRLIVLLRDPVERAYSHYYHEVNMGVEKFSFEDAISKEAERLDHEWEKMAADENYRSFNYQHYSYLSRGIYADQIQAWIRCIDREAMLIITSESMKVNPAQTFRQVTDFLGLRRWELVDFKNYHASHYPAMNAETRERLTKYFRPHNQRLSEQINSNIEIGRWGNDNNH